MIRADATRVLLRLTKVDGEVSAAWRPSGETRWRDVGKIDIALPKSTKAGVAVMNHAQGGSQPTPFSARFDQVRAVCV